ncbi:MAG: BON domain-containing protein, partial [Acidobacteriaceae bacterium]
MLTNGFRKYSFLVGTGILAACLWILAGTTALAQNSPEGDLQAAVASALTHDPMLKNQPVTAYTANGVVTLTGTVETQQQRQEAETVAANVKGVSGIQNNITVSGSESSQTAPPPPADAQQVPPPPPTETQQPAAPESQQIPPPPPP